MDEQAKWYVVHTFSGYENKVATNLEPLLKIGTCRIGSMRCVFPPRSWSR